MYNYGEILLKFTFLCKIFSSYINILVNLLLQFAQILISKIKLFCLSYLSSHANLFQLIANEQYSSFEHLKSYNLGKFSKAKLQKFEPPFFCIEKVVIQVSCASRVP